MSSEAPPSILWLWVLGLVWGLGPWLALGLAAVLAALAWQRIHLFARKIEGRPIQDGFSGYITAYRHALLHSVLAKGTLFVFFGCVAFAGLLAAGIWGLVQKSLEGITPDALEEVLPPPTTTVDPGASAASGMLDWIILVALLLAGVTIIIGFKAYRRFRQRALASVSRSTGRGTPRPLVVRLFHDNRRIGIIVTVVGCWILWGTLTQFAGLLFLVVPKAAALTYRPIPGAMTAGIVFLVIIMVCMNGIFLGPFVWLSLRNMRMQFRLIEENRVARRILNAQVIVFAGLLGALLNLYVIDLLGRSLWPAVFP